MTNTTFDKNLCEIICECVKNDKETFLFDAEKDFFLSMLKHFFSIHDFNDYRNHDLNLTEYNEFYKENIASYFSDTDIALLEQILKNEEKKMKLSNLNDSVNKIHYESMQQKQPNQLKDMLSTMLGLIEQFEKNEKVDFNKYKDRINFIKDLITDLIKYDEQKRIISGIVAEKKMEKRPKSEYRLI